MWINRIKLITLIVIGALFMFSCEKVKHTTYRMRIINEATHNYIVENDLLSSQDTTLVPLNIDSHKCGVTIFEQENANEVLPKLSEEEFIDKVSSLKIYYISDNNDTIDYGNSPEYCKELSNWEYDYSEDDGYGLHEYILRIEN